MLCNLYRTLIKTSLYVTWSFTNLITFSILQQQVFQEHLPFISCRLLIKHTSLDNLLVHVQFESCCCKDPLLYTLHCTESQHSYLIQLTNTMGTVLSLQVLEIRDQFKFTLYSTMAEIQITSTLGRSRLHGKYQAASVILLCVWGGGEITLEQPTCPNMYHLM